MTDYQYPPARIFGTFTGSGQTTGNFQMSPQFSVSLGGSFSATVLLERSPDGGTTWYPCSTDATGTVAAYNAPMSVDVVSATHGMVYRLRCTGFTSGTVNYDIWL
jgi:hypothetical protein